jgi:hypothetical protein
MARAATAAMLLLAAGLSHAQDNNKRLLITVVESVADALQAFQPVDPGLSADLTWFREKIPGWQPKNANDGLGLIASYGEILQALRNPPADPAARLQLLRDIAQDVSIKAMHCRQSGLASNQSVAVITKRNGLDEVKGLSVLYIAKFFQAKPEGHVREFAGFSSPALADLVPGVYILWSRANDGSNRTGQPKEIRIGAGAPKGPIEVLAP